MTAFAYKRPFADPKGCISERQQPANSRHSPRKKNRAEGPVFLLVERMVRGALFASEN